MKEIIGSNRSKNSWSGFIYRRRRERGYEKEESTNVKKKILIEVIGGNDI